MSGPRPDPHRPAPPVVRVRDLVRGVVATLALLVLVIGVPLLLVVIAPVSAPETWPSWEQARDAVTRPDTGQLLVTVLGLVAWTAWGAFVISTVLETAALARGIPTPRLPLLGGAQSVTAALVAAAAVLLTSPTASQPAQATSSATATSTLSPFELSARPLSKTVPVAAADGILSPTVPRHAGTSYTASPDRVSKRAEQWVTVHHGDTLWALAERHLGDGTRYRDIADLNYGRTQPDGRTLTNAHWIYPGWHLLLPTVTPRQQEGPRTDTSVVPPQRSHTLEKSVDHGRDPYLTSAQTAPPPVPTTGMALPMSPSATQASQVQRVQSDATPTSGGQLAEGASIQWPGLLALGVTSVAAAGFVTELARRRRHQQRHRKPGERIAFPEADTSAAHDEQALRIGANLNALTTLTRVLDRIHNAHTSANHEPPRLTVAWVSPTAIELAFDPDHPPTRPDMTPFTATQQQRWVADIEDLSTLVALGELNSAAAAESCQSVPALITLGENDGAVVLLNLEAAGTLTISRHLEVAQEVKEPTVIDVLRALACELATSPLTTGCSLTVTQDFGDLAAVLDASRMRTQSRPEFAVSLLAHERMTQERLASHGAADAIDGRRSGLPDLAPEVWITTDALAEPIGHAWSGHSLITTASHANQEGWSLILGVGKAHLEPLGFDLNPQRLDAETYADLLELLATTQLPSQAPVVAPENTATWTGDGRTATLSSAGSSDEASRAPAVHAAATAAGIVKPPAVDAPSCALSHPRVLLLGPVQVRTADAQADLRGRRMTELIAYLALHPDTPAPALDDALWNGQRISRGTRNALVYRARTWLGDAPDGSAYLPYADSAGRYALHPEVACDWTDFLHHVRAARRDDCDPVLELSAALDLVRDRPFLGVDPATYVWAERDTQDMISAIVDVAYELAQLHLERDDAGAAHAAAIRGLQIDPVSELLYRTAITSAARRHDAREIQRLEGQLRREVTALDPEADLEDATIDLLTSLRQYA